MERLSLEPLTLVDRAALDRAMNLAAQDIPQVAARAAHVLTHLLEGITTSSWPEVAWQFSPLTGDGFPVEFAFTTAEKETLRYTTEVSGPEHSPLAKMAIAQERLAGLGVLPFPQGVSHRLSLIQSAGTLRYGVWVGGRHSAKGDRYKLYVEVPPEISLKDLNEIAPDWIPPSPLLARKVSLRMIGYERPTERIELYYRAAALAVWEVNQLVQRLGIHDAQAQWSQFISQVYPYPLAAAIPGANVGFSVSMQQGIVQSVALFTFARSLFGGDRTIRQRLLQLSAQHKWDLSAYAKLSEPLSRQSDCKTAHGMVTFAIAPNRLPVLGIGLRPPQANPTDQPKNRP